MVEDGYEVVVVVLVGDEVVVEVWDVVVGGGVEVEVDVDVVGFYCEVE